MRSECDETSTKHLPLIAVQIVRLAVQIAFFSTWHPFRVVFSVKNCLNNLRGVKKLLSWSRTTGRHFHSHIQKILTPTPMLYMAWNSPCDWLNRLTSCEPNLEAIGSNANFLIFFASSIENNWFSSRTTKHNVYYHGVPWNFTIRYRKASMSYFNLWKNNPSFWTKWIKLTATWNQCGYKNP